MKEGSSLWRTKQLRVHSQWIRLDLEESEESCHSSHYSTGHTNLAELAMRRRRCDTQSGQGPPMNDEGGHRTKNCPSGGRLGILK